MMAPVPERVNDKHQHHQANTRSDHAQRHGARKLMLHDQRDSASNHQQECQPAEAMVVMMATMVMAVMMPPMAATVIFSEGAAVILRFIQRKFIAYADIDFTHLLFPKVAARRGCK